MDLEKGTRGRNGDRSGRWGEGPGFKLPRDGGGSVALKDFKGRSLGHYFLPQVRCTRETIDFTRLRSEFQKAGADVLRVSADPVCGAGQVQETARPDRLAQGQRPRPCRGGIGRRPRAVRMSRRRGGPRETWQTPGEADESVCPRLPSTEK